MLVARASNPMVQRIMNQYGSNRSGNRMSGQSGGNRTSGNLEGRMSNTSLSSLNHYSGNVIPNILPTSFHSLRGRQQQLQQSPGGGTQLSPKNFMANSQVTNSFMTN